MKPRDDIAQANQTLWEAEVQKGGDLQSFAEAEPGSWGHETRYVAGGFAIVAQR